MYNGYRQLYYSMFIDRNGSPSARFVLMKGIEDDGLTFSTNYGSRKAHEIVSVN